MAKIPSRPTQVNTGRRSTTQLEENQKQAIINQANNTDVAPQTSGPLSQPIPTAINQSHSQQSTPTPGPVNHPTFNIPPPTRYSDSPFAQQQQQFQHYQRVFSPPQAKPNMGGGLYQPPAGTTMSAPGGFSLGSNTHTQLGIYNQGPTSGNINQNIAKEQLKTDQENLKVSKEEVKQLKELTATLKETNQSAKQGGMGGGTFKRAEYTPQQQQQMFARQETQIGAVNAHQLSQQQFKTAAYSTRADIAQEQLNAVKSKTTAQELRSQDIHQQNLKSKSNAEDRRGEIHSVNLKQQNERLNTAINNEIRKDQMHQVNMQAKMFGANSQAALDHQQLSYTATKQANVQNQIDVRNSKLSNTQFYNSQAEGRASEKHDAWRSDRERKEFERSSKAFEKQQKEERKAYEKQQQMQEKQARQAEKQQQQMEKRQEAVNASHTLQQMHASGQLTPGAIGMMASGMSDVSTLAALSGPTKDMSEYAQRSINRMGAVTSHYNERAVREFGPGSELRMDPNGQLGVYRGGVQLDSDEALRLATQAEQSDASARRLSQRIDQPTARETLRAVDAEAAHKLDVRDAKAIGYGNIVARTAAPVGQFAQNAAYGQGQAEVATSANPVVFSGREKAIEAAKSNTISSAGQTIAAAGMAAAMTGFGVVPGAVAMGVGATISATASYFAAGSSLESSKAQAQAAYKMDRAYGSHAGIYAGQDIISKADAVPYVGKYISAPLKALASRMSFSRYESMTPLMELNLNGGSMVGEDRSSVMKEHIFNITELGYSLDHAYQNLYATASTVTRRTGEHNQMLDPTEYASLIGAGYSGSQIGELQNLSLSKMHGFGDKSFLGRTVLGLGLSRGYSATGVENLRQSIVSAGTTLAGAGYKGNFEQLMASAGGLEATGYSAYQEELGISAATRFRTSFGGAAQQSLGDIYGDVGKRVLYGSYLSEYGDPGKAAAAMQNAPSYEQKKRIKEMIGDKDIAGSLLASAGLITASEANAFMSHGAGSYGDEFTVVPTTSDTGKISKKQAQLDRKRQTSIYDGTLNNNFIGAAEQLLQENFDIEQAFLKQKPGGLSATYVQDVAATVNKLADVAKDLATTQFNMIKVYEETLSTETALTKIADQLQELVNKIK